MVGVIRRYGERWGGTAEFRRQDLIADARRAATLRSAVAGPGSP
jgi:hypothetical protein